MFVVNEINFTQILPLLVRFVFLQKRNKTIIEMNCILFLRHSKQRIWKKTRIEINSIQFLLIPNRVLKGDLFVQIHAPLWFYLGSIEKIIVTHFHVEGCESTWLTIVDWLHIYSFIQIKRTIELFISYHLPKFNISNELLLILYYKGAEHM